MTVVAGPPVDTQVRVNKVGLLEVSVKFITPDITISPVMIENMLINIHTNHVQLNVMDGSAKKL